MRERDTLSNTDTDTDTDRSKYQVGEQYGRPNNVTRSQSKVILLDNTHRQEKHQKQLSQSTCKK